VIWLDLTIETGGRQLLGVEQWAEIRRMAKVERLSQREIHRRTGLHRDTIRRALASPEPPSYGPRPKRPSKLDPFVGEIERLLSEEPTLSGVRILEEIQGLGSFIPLHLRCPGRGGEDAQIRGLPASIRLIVASQLIGRRPRGLRVVHRLGRSSVSCPGGLTGWPVRRGVLFPPPVGATNHGR
jgi:hypothetical protein